VNFGALKQHEQIFNSSLMIIAWTTEAYSNPGEVSGLGHDPLQKLEVFKKQF